MPSGIRKKREPERRGSSGATIPAAHILEDQYYVDPFVGFTPPPVAEKPTWIAEDLDALNEISSIDRDDGDLAIIRFGTWPNVHEEHFTYRGDVNKWIGEEKVVIQQLDRWSLDLGDKAQSALTNWNFFSNPNPNGCDAYLLLNGTHDFNNAAFNDDGSPTGVVTVKTDSFYGSITPFAASGLLHIANNRISYQSKTPGNPTSTFNNCARVFPVGAGAGSSCVDMTDVTQGPQGGWGILPVPISYAKELQDAGFGLQERMTSFMSPSVETVKKTIEIAAYWMPYNDGDGAVSPIDNPSGGLGFSTSLISGTVESVVKPHEREFYMRMNDWGDFPAMTFTKTYMEPRLYGRMQSGALDTGQILDTKLLVRWVGDAA